MGTSRGLGQDLQCCLLGPLGSGTLVSEAGSHHRWGSVCVGAGICYTTSGRVFLERGCVGVQSRSGCPSRNTISPTCDRRLITVCALSTDGRGDRAAECVAVKLWGTCCGSCVVTQSSITCPELTCTGQFFQPRPCRLLSLCLLCCVRRARRRCCGIQQASVMWYNTCPGMVGHEAAAFKSIHANRPTKKLSRPQRQEVCDPAQNRNQGTHEAHQRRSLAQARPWLHAAHHAEAEQHHDLVLLDSYRPKLRIAERLVGRAWMRMLACASSAPGFACSAGLHPGCMKVHPMLTLHRMEQVTLVPCPCPSSCPCRHRLSPFSTTHR